MENEVLAKSSDIMDTIFNDQPFAKALILEEDGESIGFAIYFHNYSTFLCRPGVYLEDIYVREAYRGKGYGTSVFNYLCKEAKQNNYGRVEWWCLNWNEPSI